MNLFLIGCMFGFLTIGVFCSCQSRITDNADFSFPVTKSGPLVPNMRSSTRLVKDANEHCIYNGSPLRVCFDGPACNLYRLDFLKAGKKQEPITLNCFQEMEEQLFTEIIRRICDSYGLESKRRGNVIHLKKTKSRLLLEEQYDRKIITEQSP